MGLYIYDGVTTGEKVQVSEGVEVSVGREEGGVNGLEKKGKKDDGSGMLQFGRLREGDGILFGR